MKIKNLISLSLLISLSFSCSQSSNETNNINELGTEISSSKKALGVEDNVSKDRIDSYLKVLTGKTPPEGKTVIPERGTVEGRDMTKEYLTKTLTDLGYKVEKHTYRKNGANIFTKLMAETPSDEYVLLGAHMDSVRNAGADDNGSGSTAVLEAASVLKDLKGRKVNIIFAWFDEEELGLVGSEYLATDFKKKGMKIIAAHTIDMMGWDGDGDKTIELARPDGILWDYYNMVNKTHNLKLKFDRTNTGQSDHVSFHEKGYNSICLSEEWTSGDTTPNYHKRSDTYETVNLDFLTTGTKLLVAVVGDMSLKVPAPENIKIIPNSNFPSRDRHFHNN